MENKRTALLVDDDPDQLLVLKLLLERSGFEVEAARSGEEGLKVAQSLPLEIIICDLRMPGMGGLEMVRRVREGESGTSTRVPVVILTASPNYEQQAIDAGADRVCLKRAANGELRRIIREILSKSA